MHVKITQSGSRRYVQLVESYRDENGRPKKRTVATLGRVEQLQDELDTVITGLLKLVGRDAKLGPAFPAAAQCSFEPARAYGDVWALTQLWQELGFNDLQRLFRRTRHSIEVEALIRLMVFNRLCDPESKLGTLRWLGTVALPDLDVTSVLHQHLLRAMDALEAQREDVDRVLAGLLRPMVDRELSVVFYDLTTIRAEGSSEQAGDLRQYGMSKEGIVARQILLGVVQTAEGLPIYHEVFDGNVAETRTLLPTLRLLLERFPAIQRLVLVADRGLLSLDNLAQLQALRLRDNQPLEFILAVPARRYNEFTDQLQAWHEATCRDAQIEVLHEQPWQQLRLVAAHDPERASEQREARQRRLAELLALGEQWAQKLDRQDGGQRARGRALSHSGAKARFYRDVSEAHLLKTLKVDLKGDWFSYDVDEAALARAEQMDGKLILLTNVPDMTAAEVVQRYKSLADIERGFRVLKNEIEIGPIYHRLPERIRAHAAICFMALILYRVMRMRLKQRGLSLSPEAALARLQQIQYHQVKFDPSRPAVRGVGTINAAQHEALRGLGLQAPKLAGKMTLLPVV